MTEIVAVDIGGTHARFAIAEAEDGRVVSVGDACTLKTAEHASLQTAWVGQLVRRGGHDHVIETEGGHIDFAPLDSLDDQIVAYLCNRYRRVSAERLASGMGHGAGQYLRGAGGDRGPAA